MQSKPNRCATSLSIAIHPPALTSSKFGQSFFHYFLESVLMKINILSRTKISVSLRTSGAELSRGFHYRHFHGWTLSPEDERVFRGANRINISSKISISTRCQGRTNRARHAAVTSSVWGNTSPISAMSADNFSKVTKPWSSGSNLLNDLRNSARHVTSDNMCWTVTVYNPLSPSSIELESDSSLSLVPRLLRSYKGWLWVECGCTGGRCQRVFPRTFAPQWRSRCRRVWWGDCHYSPDRTNVFMYRPLHQ